MPRDTWIFEHEADLDFLERGLEKIAQQNLTQQDYQLALKMLDNIVRQNRVGSKVDSQDQTKSLDTMQPKQSDLVSLDTFIVYLANNHLQYNGQPIVQMLGNEKAPGYVKYKSNLNLGSENIFSVNPTALVGILQEFADHANTSGNLYFKELIGKLIDDVKMDKQLSVPANSFDNTAIQTKLEQQKAQERNPNKQTNTENDKLVGDKENNQNAYQHADQKETAEQSNQQEQNTARSEFILPFNPSTNIFSIAQMEGFYNGLTQMINSPYWNQEAQRNVQVSTLTQMIGSAQNRFNGLLNNYRGIVSKQAGFEKFSQAFLFDPDGVPSQLANNLLQMFSTYTTESQKIDTKDIAQLMEIASTMTNTVLATLQALLNNPQTAQIGEQELKNQYQYGYKLVNVMHQVSVILQAMVENSRVR